MSTWTLKEKSTGELKVTIEGENWKTAQKKAFNKLAKELEIPGFRKGSVPAAMAKKYVPAQKIMLEAVEHCAQGLLDAGTLMYACGAWSCWHATHSGRALSR